MNKRFLALWVFLGIMFFTTSLLVLISHTKLQKIIVIGNIANLKGLNILNNQRLLFIKNEEIIKQLTKINPAIKNIFIEKKYPDTLVLQVEERKVFVQVIGSGHKAYYDKEGVPIEYTNVSFSLPLINAEKINVSKERVIDWRIMKAIKITEDFQKLNINIEDISIVDNENNFIVKLTQDGKVIIPYKEDAANIAASLQIIIHRFRIEGKFIEKIDFRFEKPIVSLSNGEKISSDMR